MRAGFKQHWRDRTILKADKLRLARRLVGMAEGYGVQGGKGDTRRVLAVTQQELALMIGVSRQTTNQILKELETRGILRVRRGKLEILDLAALRSQTCPHSLRSSMLVGKTGRFGI